MYYSYQEHIQSLLESNIRYSNDVIQKLSQLKEEYEKEDRLMCEYYVTECGGMTFHLPIRYQNIEPVGSGGFGCVVSAYDQVTGTKVAIKKISNLFERERSFQKRILRECKILRHLRNHENIVQLIDLILPLGFEQFNDVYIVTNLMDFDLNKLLRRDNQPFTEQAIQYFLHQILRGLKYIHSANIIHRDLKPENILLNRNMDLMICDFGLSRGIANGDYPDESKYVVTRWYRAPEVILFWDQLSKAIDIWSVGCIFAELLCNPPRQILFKGSNFKDQFDLILKKCGTPSNLFEIKGCEAGLKYYRENYSHMFFARVDFQRMFSDANPLAIDLLDKMLQIDPNKRITVEEALSHPYLDLMHDENDEITCPNEFNFGFYEDIPVQIIKNLLYEEHLSLYEENKQMLMEERRKSIESIVEEDVLNSAFEM
jgi:serine/threonine protein kinase